MNKKSIIIGIILAMALGSGLYYRSVQTTSGDAEHKEAGHGSEKAGEHDEHNQDTGDGGYLAAQG